MKRIVPFILLFVALLLPSTVFARIGLFPVTGIKYDGLGETTVERLSPGRFKVTTVGQAGAGTVECGGNPNCLFTGLDGSTINFLQQDMQIVIDWKAARVRGRVRGNIVVPEVHQARFRGEIRGQVVRGNEQVHQVKLLIKARVGSRTGGIIGIMELELAGELNTGDDLTLPGWDKLGGAGTIAFDKGYVGPGR